MKRIHNVNVNFKNVYSYNFLSNEILNKIILSEIQSQVYFPNYSKKHSHYLIPSIVVSIKTFSLLCEGLSFCKLFPGTVNRMFDFCASRTSERKNIYIGIFIPALYRFVFLRQKSQPDLIVMIYVKIV
jgi:hypothetical protein